MVCFVTRTGLSTDDSLATMTEPCGKYVMSFMGNIGLKFQNPEPGRAQMDLLKHTETTSI